MIDVDSLVNWAEVGGVKDFWREHPIGTRILRVDFSCEFSHAQIAQLELNGARLLGRGLILGEGSEDIGEMNVLVNVSILVEILNSLQQAARDRHQPGLPLEALYGRKEVGEGAVAALGDDVEGITKLEGIVHER